MVKKRYHCQKRSKSEGGELRMRTTNENKRILENLGKNKRTRICPFLPIFCPFLGKKGQKRAKNGRTKSNPGKTGRNQKFRRILIRDRQWRFATPWWKHLVVPQPKNRTHNICPRFGLPTQWHKVEVEIVP